MNRRQFLLSGSIAAGTFAFPTVFASSYPTRPVSLIVPFPAGGGTDTLARRLARFVADKWGVPVVVENKPGAGGGIGAAQVASAKPDGHTLLMTTAGVSSINPELYSKLSYDPATQFSPISRVAATVFVVVVNPSLQVKSIKELIALAKSKPGTLTFGTAGNGAAGHLPAELFKNMADIGIQHIPYRGTSPALVDLQGGQISMMFAILGAALPAIKSGALRALATTGQQRSVVLPDLPTVAEDALPGYSADEWWGVAAPAGTPPAAIDRWNLAMGEFFKDAESNAWLVGSGFEPVYDSPGAFADLIASDRKKWSKVIHDAGVVVG